MQSSGHTKESARENSRAASMCRRQCITRALRRRRKSDARVRYFHFCRLQQLKALAASCVICGRDDIDCAGIAFGFIFRSELFLELTGSCGDERKTVIGFKYYSNLFYYSL